MNKDRALFLYMDRLHPTFRTPYERFLDEPKNWVRKNRPLTPSELDYAQRALDELSELQARERAQARLPSVQVYEELRVGKPELSVPFFSEQT